MIRRITNWPIALATFMESRKNTRFAWGKHDCCMFAADAIRTITGVDLAATYRGYDSKEACREIIELHGGMAGLMESITAAHGLKECQIAFAKRGDLVLIDGSIGETIGIIALNSKPCAPARRGYTFADKADVIKAWSIG